MAHDPSYAPHHANLAALLWAAGRRVEAVAGMELAQQWAPRAALFPLNLGVYYEAAGDETAAAGAYTRALDLGGRQASVFWRATPLRAAVLDDWLVSRPAGTDGAWSAPKEGDLAQARQHFEATLAGSPNSIAAYRGLAAVARGEGDLGAAGRHLQTALFIGATYSPHEHRRAQMDWARLAAEQGELDEAIDRAAPILEAFRRQSFWGPGRSGTPDYGWYVFYRESFWSDMLPQVITAGLPDEVGGWMVETAGWHRQVGETEAARTLCREVLDAIPDHVAAGECLDTLAD
jgi:tetratricopeptide (TPR) repeat protein